MPQIKLENVTLAFTQNMTRESEYGGFNYAFIVNENELCDKVREALATQKTQLWTADKNTNKFICSKANLKHKDDVNFDAVRELMTDDDVLVTVKSKQHPIDNSKHLPLARGTKADVIVDFFEFEYGKKQMICVRAHADKGLTVKVKKLVIFACGLNYFEDDTHQTEQFESDEAFNESFNKEFPIDSYVKAPF